MKPLNPRKMNKICKIYKKAQLDVIKYQGLDGEWYEGIQSTDNLGITHNKGYVYDSEQYCEIRNQGYYDLKKSIGTIYENTMTVLIRSYNKISTSDRLEIDGEMYEIINVIPYNNKITSMIVKGV